MLASNIGTPFLPVIILYTQKWQGRQDRLGRNTCRGRKGAGGKHHQSGYEPPGSETAGERKGSGTLLPAIAIIVIIIAAGVAGALAVKRKKEEEGKGER